MAREAALKRYSDPVQHVLAREAQLKRLEDPVEAAAQRERALYMRSKVKFGVSLPQLAFGLALLDAGYDVYCEVMVAKPGPGAWFIDWWDPERQIAWEVDGWFHSWPSRVVLDQERDAELARRGIVTIRISVAEARQFVRRYRLER